MIACRHQIFWVWLEDHGLDEINFVIWKVSAKKTDQSCWRNHQRKYASNSQEKCAAWMMMFCRTEETNHTDTFSMVDETMFKEVILRFYETTGFSWSLVMIKKESSLLNSEIEIAFFF